MKDVRNAERYDIRRKRVRATLVEFGIKRELVKRIDHDHPVGVLEKLAENTKKRRPEDPASYFLNGLDHSRIKHETPPLFRSLKKKE